MHLDRLDAQNSPPSYAFVDFATHEEAPQSERRSRDSQRHVEFEMEL